MTDRTEATIKFKMPEEWIDSQHPVGKAIQSLFTELAKAYHELNGESDAHEHAPWAEWVESYKDVEDA
ncbi:hypothetical protein [Stenotrophomonas virus Jojan60]|nr:hypothetical protein [Stenotrophomonas virus Jojan60]